MPQRGTQFSGLPDDLVAGILCFLPPREVARARLVCKRWRALTTDHHFVRASFSMRHAGHGRHVAGFFFNHRQWSTTEYFALDPGPEAGEEGAAGDHLTPDLSFIPRTFPVDPELGILKVRGSCGGLLLLLAIRPPSNPLGDMHNIHIYSSETQSWRTPIPLDHSRGLLQGIHSMHGVFWNGSVVWIMSHSLVRFIIEEEHVTDMPMPSKKKDWSCAYIGESGGHLQMIGYTKKDKLTACFDVLEMQENMSEWSVLYQIDLNRVKHLYPDIEWPTWDTRHSQQKIIDYLALSPIYVIRGTGKTGQHGVLVFSIPGRIVSYNMEDQAISMLKETGCPYPLE